MIDPTVPGEVVATDAGAGPAVVSVDASGVVRQAGADLAALLGADDADGSSVVGTSLLDRLAPREHELLRALLAPADEPRATLVVGRRDDGLPLALVVERPAGVDAALVLRRWGGPVGRSADGPLAAPERSGPDHVLSHDARATVRNARNFVNLFRRKLPGDTELPAGHLDTALRALATGDDTLDRIVWFTRLEHDPLTVQELPLATVVELARRQASSDLEELAAAEPPEVGPLLAAPIELDWATDPAATSVVGNLELLTWLVAELLVDARKFGGPLARVTAAAAPADASGRFVDVTITDDGRPIDPTLAEDAFRLGRLLQPRGERPGIGMGLPLARRLALRHGGRLAFAPDAVDAAGQPCTARRLGLVAAGAGATVEGVVRPGIAGEGVG